MTRMAGSVKGISSFLNLKPGYGDIGGQGIQDTAQEIATIMQGNAMAANAGLKADADIASAKHYGSAQRSIGNSQANAAIFGGAMSALGNIGSAAITKFGKPKDTTPFPTQGTTLGDYSGGLKNYDPGVWTTNLRFGK